MKTRHAILTVMVLILGIVGAALLTLTRETPQRKEKPFLGPLVETIKVQPADNLITIDGTGEAYARNMTTLVSQVSGKVVKISPNLVGGGHFKSGEVLLKIDPRDYELAVESTEAAVIRAEVQLETQQAEAHAAEEEWDAIHPGEKPSSALVLHQPQIRQAEAEVKAAKAQLEAARLQLERTELFFPFDGIILNETADIGQFVTTGKSLATVYSTSEIEVRVPIESRELASFDLPGPRRAGAEARIFADLGGESLSWRGRVSRIEGQIDPKSRMAPIILDVPGAFVVEAESIPLYPGTFVRVEIQGHTLPSSYVIPSSALQEDNTVWVVHDNQLDIRPVSIGRIEKETVIITSGLNAGEHVVTSLLEAVTMGMTVREASQPGGAV